MSTADMTNAEFVSCQRTAINAAVDITPAQRSSLLAWCDAGCPADESTDAGFEDGDFC